MFYTCQEAGNANLGIPDNEVLTFAIEQNRVVLTTNRLDFIRLHRHTGAHSGIIFVLLILMSWRLPSVFISQFQIIMANLPINFYAFINPLEGDSLST
jgi:predicted nuclease of predicted toxin-antitoxin system